MWWRFSTPLENTVLVAHIQPGKPAASAQYRLGSCLHRTLIILAEQACAYREIFVWAGLAVSVYVWVCECCGTVWQRVHVRAKERERERGTVPPIPLWSPLHQIPAMGNHSLSMHIYIEADEIPPWALPCDCSLSTKYVSPLCAPVSMLQSLEGERGKDDLHTLIGNLWGANQWYSSLCFPLWIPKKLSFFCMAIIRISDTFSRFRHYCANHWLTWMDVGLKRELRGK